MIVWGGMNDSGQLNTGGRYSPSGDSWLSTSVGPNVPSPRINQASAWTGFEMLVWGGWNGAAVVGAGSRYDPSNDSWAAMTTVGEPAPREFSQAIWTGTQFIAWGGDNGTIALNSGGRYDPSSNMWTATALANAPSGRHIHTVVWTGSEMIVWGGDDFSIDLASGGKYNPVTNAWAATSLAGAPSVRNYHSAVWTGSEMIVFGGYSSSSGSAVNSGARYAPGTDSWAPTSTTGAAARYAHTAVWSGSQMLVWGLTSTGGLYCAVPTCTVQTWYRDADGDSYGNSSDNVLSCTQPTGYIANGTDCNDANAGINPGAAEVCDGIDNDCDTVVDDGVTSTFYQDADGDGFGNAAATTQACSAPAGYTTDSTDCNDADGDAWATPGEVTGVVFAADHMTMSWTAPATGGTAAGMLYDVLRSDVSSDFVTTAVCIESDDGPNTTAADAAVPAAGSPYFYLHRAQNSCPAGVGTLGQDSLGNERVGRTCP
jgi:hypothetical protein